MKKILILVIVLLAIDSRANNLDKKEIELNKISNEFFVEVQKDFFNPVACCTRRGSTGTYGHSDYNQVTITTCETSTISYQDAHSRACAKAETMVTRALQIAAITNEPTPIPPSSQPGQ